MPWWGWLVSGVVGLWFLVMVAYILVLLSMIHASQVHHARLRRKGL